MGQWAALRPCFWECSPKGNLAGFCTFCWHSWVLWCFWPGWRRGCKSHRHALSPAFPSLGTAPCVCQLHSELFQHSSPLPSFFLWEAPTVELGALLPSLSCPGKSPSLLAPPAHWRVLLDCTSAQLDCKRALDRGIDDTRVAHTLIRCNIVIGSFHAEGSKLV